MPTDSEAQPTAGRVTEQEVQDRNRRMEPIRQALRDIQESAPIGSIADTFRNDFWKKIGSKPTDHSIYPPKPTLTETSKNTIQDDVTKQ